MYYKMLYSETSWFLHGAVLDKDIIICAYSKIHFAAHSSLLRHHDKFRPRPWKTVLDILSR